MAVKSYRKKPVVIEAIQLPEAYPEGVDPSSDEYARNLQAMEVYRWVEANTQGSFDPLADEVPASGVIGSAFSRSSGVLSLHLRSGWWPLGVHLAQTRST